MGTNLFIGEEVEKKNAGLDEEKNIKRYWIGLRVMSSDSTSGATWASGEESSVAVGHWYPGHPDPQVGLCTSIVADDTMQYPWKLTWCEMSLPFVCQRQACLQGEYLPELYVQKLAYVLGLFTVLLHGYRLRCINFYFIHWLSCTRVDDQNLKSEVESDVWSIPHRNNITL